jgi:hypothetical protein
LQESKMSQEINRYGVHWGPAKLAFLHQTRGGLNAVGLRDNSPFVVRTSRRWNCNHVIGLNVINPARDHLVSFHSLIQKNALVRFMLPLPKDIDRDTKNGIGLLTTKDIMEDMLVIAFLCKMSSPVKIPVFWANLTTPNAIITELEMTDVQPLVLAGITSSTLKMTTDIIRAAAVLPRRLLLIADDDVPLHGVTTLGSDHIFNQDEVDLALLPWEALGAITLRAYMRGEWDGSWFTREPIPGNESKERAPAHGRSPTPGLPDS